MQLLCFLTFPFNSQQQRRVLGPCGAIGLQSFLLAPRAELVRSYCDFRNLMTLRTNIINRLRCLSPPLFIGIICTIGIKFRQQLPLFFIKPTHPDFHIRFRHRLFHSVTQLLYPDENIIGIGRRLTAPLLPQHRAYGARTTAFQVKHIHRAANSGKPKSLKYRFGNAW